MEYVDKGEFLFFGKKNFIVAVYGKRENAKTTKILSFFGIFQKQEKTKH